MAPETALKHWMGPDKRLHDFQFQRCHVEVKCNATRSNRSATISDLSQLDESCAPGDILFLAYIKLEKVKAKDHSLSALREKIEQKLIDSQKRLLEEKLGKAQWYQIDRAVRDSTRFKAKAPDFFKVIKGFPRLLNSDIPERVKVKQYEIQVPQNVEFFIPDEDLIENIK